MVLMDKLWRMRWKVKPPGDEDNNSSTTQSNNNYNKRSNKAKIFRKKIKRKLGKNKAKQSHPQGTSSTSTGGEDYGAILPNDEVGHEYHEYATLREDTPLLLDEEQGLPSITSQFSPSDSWSILLYLTGFHIVIYLVISVVGYSYWLEPEWTIIDSLYFATNLYTTVGQGDKEPDDPTSQLFTVFMSVYGVLVLGVFLGIIGHAVSEGQAEMVQRMKERNRQTVLNTLVNSADNNSKPDEPPPPDSKKKNSPTKPVPPSKPPPSTQNLTNNNNKPADDNNKWTSDLMALFQDIWIVFKMEAPEIILVVALAFVVGVREGWSIIQTLYFCIMSASTTGFGDFGAQSQSDKLFCVFFLPLSVAVLGEVLGRIATLYLQRKIRQKEQAFLRKTITLCDLRRMDANQDDTVDMEEFLTFMLVALQKVDPQDLEDLKQTFYALDANGNGLLDKDDLQILTNLAHNASKEAGPDSAWSQLELTQTKQD